MSAVEPWIEKIRLLVVTDPEWIGSRSWPEVVRSVLRGGARAIQLRHKGATARELFDLGRALRAVTRDFDALFFVNDRTDVALACGADGVHLGPSDLPVSRARAYVPRDFLIGASADTVETACAAERDGADYLGVGSIFDTTTKSEVAGERIGVERVREVAGAVRIPVIGIGGVTAENAASVIAAGARGIAVVRAVLSESDPEAAVRALVARLR